MLTLTRKLQQLPVHGVPEHLPTLDDPHADLEPFNHLDVDNNADQEQTPQHNATGPQKVSHSFIPQQQEQQQEQDAIWTFIKSKHPLNWPSMPMQEILEMSFKQKAWQLWHSANTLPIWKRRSNQEKQTARCQIN